MMLKMKMLVGGMMIGMMMMLGMLMIGIQLISFCVSKETFPHTEIHPENVSGVFLGISTILIMKLSGTFCRKIYQ